MPHIRPVLSYPMIYAKSANVRDEVFLFRFPIFSFKPVLIALCCSVCFTHAIFQIQLLSLRTQWQRIALWATRTTQRIGPSGSASRSIFERKNKRQWWIWFSLRSATFCKGLSTAKLRTIPADFDDGTNDLCYGAAEVWHALKYRWIQGIKWSVQRFRSSQFPWPRGLAVLSSRM